MWYTNVYSNVKVYQNILHVGYSSKKAVLRAVCMRAQVLGPKEARHKSEGTGIRTPSPLRRLRQGPSYSPNRFVCQSATLKD